MSAHKNTIYFFLSFLALYGFLQSRPSWLDPDSFYHAKMVEILRDRGVVKEFVWLTGTDLAKSFADHHLLYHALNVPLALLVPAPVALKILAALLAAAAVTALFLLLKLLRAPYSAAFAVFAGTAMTAAMRLLLAKSSSLALLIQFGIITALLTKKPRWLFPLGFAYAWSHGSWPVALVIVGAHALVHRHDWRTGVRHVVLVAGGLLAGLIVNPYFPQSTQYYLDIIYRISLAPVPSEVRVGMEWYPLPSIELLGTLLPMIAVLVLAAFVAHELRRRKLLMFPSEARKNILWLGSLAACFLVLSLRSQRHIEYLVPYLTLSVGALWGALVESGGDAIVREHVQSWRTDAFRLFALRVVAALLAVYVVASLAILWKSFWLDAMPWNHLKAASEYVEAHSKTGDIVYNSEWDNFPELFYWNDANRYVGGLDARLMYYKNPAAMLKYQEGIPKDGSFVSLFDSFGARYVLIEKHRNKDAMIPVLKGDSHFVLRYEDDEATVFERTH